jgi:hypothetical protein
MPKQTAAPSEAIADEESVGETGRGGFVCRLQADGSSRSYSKQSHVELAPGSCFRVSVGASGKKRGLPKRVARLLAFVDPLTGHLVVRMGMYDITATTKGAEEGPQIVWTSDAPVCDIDTRED